MWERLDGAVQVGPQRLDQDLAQHRAGVGLRAHVAAGHPRPQGRDDRFGDDGAEVGDQQGVLDVLPGVLVKVTAAEQAEHAAAERVLRLGEPPPQPLEAAFCGCDLVEHRRGGNFLNHRRLGELDVGDGPLRGVAREGGIIADGGQPAGIDPFDGLSGCRLRERDA